MGAQIGSDANEVIHTTDSPGFVIAGGGADTVTGGAGGDAISGGGGNDTISGGAGNDVILAGKGDDVLRGGAGSDVLEGGEGSDTFYYDAKSVDHSQDVIMDFSLAEGDSFKFAKGIKIVGVEGGNFADKFGNGHALGNEPGSNDVKLTILNSATGDTTTVWLLDVISGDHNASWWQDYFI